MSKDKCESDLFVKDFGGSCPHVWEVYTRQMRYHLRLRGGNLKVRVAPRDSRDIGMVVGETPVSFNPSVPQFCGIPDYEEITTFEVFPVFLDILRRAGIEDWRKITFGEDL